MEPKMRTLEMARAVFLHGRAAGAHGVRCSWVAAFRRRPIMLQTAKRCSPMSLAFGSTEL
eukprot:1981980-Alexandrium_andersonii.AAC.1